MLSNFMNLVTAVEISGSLIMSNAHIDIYRNALLRYLQGMKALHKEAKFVSNHHMAIHVANTILPNFSPLHAIRAFHTERFNFLLQTENTNGKLDGVVFLFCPQTTLIIFHEGELELTYTRHTSRASNMKVFLQDEIVHDTVSKMTDALEDIELEDHRGTRIQEAFFHSRQRQEVGTTEDGILNYQQLVSLADLLSNGGDRITSRPISKEVTFLSQVQVHGISYKHVERSARDSRILFCQVGNLADTAAQIECIFWHKSCRIWRYHL